MASDATFERMLVQIIERLEPLSSDQIVGQDAASVASETNSLEHLLRSSTLA